MVVITAVVVIFVLVLIFAYASIRILREYERGVVFTLGRYTGTKGPGLFLLVPFVQQMVRVDLRVVVDEVPPQDVISRDNVSVKVSAVIYFRVVDAERAIIQVSNYLAATSVPLAPEDSQIGVRMRVCLYGQDRTHPGSS
jgi:regulator of protease activity HflC (stomatin/prohibitin superfamily)